ncbi:hypothetical protein ACWGH5_16090 [Streptomyces sp. NPDC054864]
MLAAAFAPGKAAFKVIKNAGGVKKLLASPEGFAVNTQNTDATGRRTIPWTGAAMLAFGYAVFYMPMAYCIDHPISLHWLIWPVVAVAGLTFASDWKGIGDRPWFVRTVFLLIVLVAIIGVVLS